MLQVSDGVRVFLHENEVELTAIVNLNKLGRVEPRAREALEKFDKVFWIIEDGRVAISLYGTPIVRRAGLGVKDTFRAKVGEIEFSNDTLRQLNVPVEKANDNQLDIRYLSLKSVTVSQTNIEFRVAPRL